MKQIKDILNVPQENNDLMLIGFDAVDELVGGYKSGELIAFAGHAVSGRRMLMYSIARKLVFEKGVAVGLIDVAENAKTIARNILGEDCNCMATESTPLYVNEKLRLNAEELCLQIVELNRTQNVQCFIIEGFSFIDFSTEDKYALGVKEANLVKELKRLTVELNITIFVGASLNWQSWERADFDGSHTSLCDVSGVGDFDEFADIVIGIDRPEALQIYFDEKGNDLHGIIKLEVLKGTRGEFRTLEIHNETNQ